jgi:type VI secretion system protein ImpJ
MKIYRPLWEDGAALAPQQFQQQARWNEHVADMVARMGFLIPGAWLRQNLMMPHWRSRA